MHTDLSLQEIKKEWHGTYRSYMIGLIASLLLTGTSFLLVATKILSPPFLTHTIVGLALLQALVQMRFFLHLGQEEKPRWESVMFFSMLLILLIIVIGSLWIMYDLNDRVMSHMRYESPTRQEVSHD